MIFDDVPFILVLLRENEESKKPVVMASCGLEHDMIVISKDIILRRSILLKRLVLSSVLRSHLLIWSLLIQPSLSSLLKTSQFLLPYRLHSITPLFYGFLNVRLLGSENCTIYALNLDRTHELDVSIGLENWVHREFMIHSSFVPLLFSRLPGSYPLHKVMLGTCVTLMIGPRALISSREFSLQF